MKRICIFGDSITWGAGLPFRAAWANLLRNYLEDESEGVIELYDLGIDRNTSGDLLKRFDGEAEARTPNIIIFAIGTNDSVFRMPGNKAEVTVEEYKENLEKLVEKARRFTDEIYFVGLAKGDDALTCPLQRSTTGKCYSKEQMAKYNHAAKEVAESEKLTFIDIAHRLKDEDFDDGVHPNIGGHVKIFEEVRRELKI